MAADMDILQDFFLVDQVAEGMQWTFVPHLCVEAVRELQAAAGNADSHPDTVLAAVLKLQTAIGGANLVAVVAHDLWDEWCPQPADTDPESCDNGNGVVVWAGKRGYVKLTESDGSGQWEINLHSVRL